MPGLVLCGRRWSIASDDIFIPAIVVLIVHLISIGFLLTSLMIISYDPHEYCSVSMYEYIIAYLIVLFMMLILEIMALFNSCQGTVLDSKPRRFLQYLIYTRLSN